MDYKIITPVVAEPVTLAEAKTFLRLSSDTFSGDVETRQSIVPGNHNIAALTGAAVDVLGYVSLVMLNTGTCAGTVTAKIEESDDGVTWQGFADFDVATAANDNAVQEINYTGGKQYIRIQAMVTDATCEFSADVLIKSGDPVEDNFVLDLITGAREFCEEYTRRALATQTIEQYMDHFPFEDRFEVARPPLQSVLSMKYKDSSGTETTMVADTDYLVDIDSTVGRIVLPYSKAWPMVTMYPVNPIKVRYIAGYTSLPKLIKQAMYLHIGFFYANRDAVELNEQTDRAIKRMLTLYRVGWF